MEKYYKVFIEEVAFIDKGRYHSMILDCVRPNGDRFELWMDISERSSRTHLANWRHVRQMLKLYGINIADLAREHFDEKAVWAKVVDKFYRLKLDVTKKGIFMRRVEGIAEPFDVPSRDDTRNADHVLENWEALS